MLLGLKIIFFLVSRLALLCFYEMASLNFDKHNTPSRSAAVTFLKTSANGKTAMLRTYGESGIMVIKDAQNTILNVYN
jgi:hypothetical protein